MRSLLSMLCGVFLIALGVSALVDASGWVSGALYVAATVTLIAYGASFLFR